MTRQSKPSYEGLFITSDTHAGHKNLITKIGTRNQFHSVEHMNQVMIDNWNSVVGPNDTVYHLGDFTVWYSNFDFEEFRNQLNGNIILIRGNHDAMFFEGGKINPFDQDRFKNCFQEIHQYLELVVGGDNLKLFHYPMEDWNGKFHGAVHFYGHTHQTNNDNQLPYRWNVGVDANNFTPLPLETAVKLAKGIH